MEGVHEFLGVFWRVDRSAGARAELKKADDGRQITSAASGVIVLEKSALQPHGFAEIDASFADFEFEGEGRHGGTIVNLADLDMMKLRTSSTSK